MRNHYTDEKFGWMVDNTLSCGVTTPYLLLLYTDFYVALWLISVLNQYIKFCWGHVNIDAHHLMSTFAGKEEFGMKDTEHFGDITCIGNESVTKVWHPLPNITDLPLEFI